MSKRAMTTLRLVEIDDQLLAAARESGDALAARLGASLAGVAAETLEIVAQTGAFLRAKPRERPWGCFLAIDAAAAQVIGTCGFKNGPTDDGAAELAYYTFPAFENRGYATLMAAELLKLAAGQPVIAHTLPERNASCRVLEKNGFSLVGDVVDPDDGNVWRWATTS